MKKFKGIIFMWHPIDSSAGGFVRIKELIKYLNQYPLIIIDRYPSEFSKHSPLHRVIEYKIPRYILVFYNLNFYIGRTLEWAYSLFSLIYIGLRQANKDIQFIYVPIGELPHLMLSGVVVKILKRKKLLMDILNLETKKMNRENNFHSVFTRSGVFKEKSLLYGFGALMLLALQRRLLQFADVIVTVSPYLKNILQRYYGKEIFITQSGINFPKIHRKVSHKFDGIYVGRHSAEKGIFNLLKAWKSVSDERRGAKLVMVGSCDPDTKRKIENFIKKQKLHKNIILKGHVEESEKITLLQQSRVFIHLAEFEPLVPVITILEALSVGLPIVVYDIEAFDDYPLLRKEKSLFIVPNGNSGKASDVIIDLLRHKKNKMLHESAISLARKYDWSEIAKQQNAAIAKLVG